MYQRKSLRYLNISYILILRGFEVVCLDCKQRRQTARSQIGRSFTRAPNSLSAGRHLPPPSPKRPRGQKPVPSLGQRPQSEDHHLRHTVHGTISLPIHSTHNTDYLAIRCLEDVSYVVDDVHLAKLPAGWESLGDARLWLWDWPDRVTLSTGTLPSRNSKRTDAIRHATVETQKGLVDHRVSAYRLYMGISVQTASTASALDASCMHVRSAAVPGA
jgi:hypothetical protein